MCIAHRGASGHVTENTLAAFSLATQLGAQMWELDTQLSRDGVVFVSHDDHLLRVFGADLRISELLADEISATKLGVPSFEEVAAEARAVGAGLYVELKARGSGPKVWEHLAAHDQRFACIGSFDIAQIQELRSDGCDYALSVLVGFGDEPIGTAKQADADVVHLCWERASARPQEMVTARLLAEAFGLNLEVVLWHEERPSVLADLVKMPVLGICTDLPDLMQPPAAAYSDAFR